MITEIIISVVIIAFILEFFDASLGQGYGALTPILILLGFEPLQVVFAVIFTSAILSLLAGFLHHGFKNVDFSIGSKDFKISSVLTIFGIIGVLIGAFVALHISTIMLEEYIGAIILLTGLLILARHEKKYHFSWKKLMVIGPIAAFNKGMTGGGFGPVITGGQIIAGVDSKKAVGIAAITEGIVSVVGIVAYLVLMGSAYINTALIVSLLIGGLISTPLAAYSVKRVKAEYLKMAIATISIALGAVLLSRIFM